MSAPLDEFVRRLVREEIRRLVREDALHEILDDEAHADEDELRELVQGRAAKLRRARRGGQ